MATKICENGHRYSGGKCPYCPDGNHPRKPHKTRLFGTTIRETVEILKPTNKADKTAQRDRRVIFTRVAVSVAILVAAIVVWKIEGSQSGALGLFGTVIGYWLK